MARADLQAVGTDIRTARVGAGLSLASVGQVVGLSHSQVGRIERGLCPTASVSQLARIGAVVGLDVRVRSYPGGPPLRDAAQVALIERLRGQLHPGFRLVLEVPVGRLAGAEPVSDGRDRTDQRAWDAVIRHEGETAVEAVTRLNDLQALLRRIALKQRDAEMDRVILLLSDTMKNRAALRAAGPLIDAAFPIPARVALAALRAGRHPGGSSVIRL